MHLDTDNLEMLKTVIGDELVGLLQLYLDSAPQTLQQLQSAVEQQDFLVIEHQAHTLKGSAGNVGAADLADLSAQLNNLAQQQQATGMSELMQAIAAEANTVETLMKDYINNFAA